MQELAERFPSSAGVTRRALNQALREVLLAQSSDWAFIMTRNTVVPYAVQRTRDHLLHFRKLYETLMSGTIEESWLAELEARNTIFPNMDYAVYRRDYHYPMGEFRSHP
jgi:1,4-alpha-glucan branching enzyme